MILRRIKYGKVIGILTIIVLLIAVVFLIRLYFMEVCVMKVRALDYDASWDKREIVVTDIKDLWGGCKWKNGIDVNIVNAKKVSKLMADLNYGFWK